MKIRIKGNTVRYRLAKSEVSALAERGVLEEGTDFGTGTLGYAIRQTEAPQPSADFAGGTITLYIPRPDLQSWAVTDAVGIEHHMPLPGGGSLYLLLEKDFKCLDADGVEDQSDFFENPNQTC